MKKITKEQLEKLYKNNTNEQCCKILGVAHTTFITLLDEAGIKKKVKVIVNEKKLKSYAKKIYKKQR